MVRVESERDIEILRQIAILQDREIARLHARLVAVTRENAQLQGRDVSALQHELEGLRELLAAQARQLYGDSSEKRSRGGTNGKEPKAPVRGHGPTEQRELPIVETLHELDVRLAAHARQAGIQSFLRAPALNDAPGFIAALKDLVLGAGGT